MNEGFDPQALFPTPIIWTDYGDEAIASPASPEDEVCDFCSRLEHDWVYPASDFEMDGSIVTGSIGAWNACGDCAKFIDENDWEGLIENFKQLEGSPFYDLHIEEPLLYAKLVKNIIPVYETFTSARTGEKVPYDEYTEKT